MWNRTPRQYNSQQFVYVWEQMCYYLLLFMCFGFSFAQVSQTEDMVKGKLNIFLQFSVGDALSPPLSLGKSQQNVLVSVTI